MIYTNYDSILKRPDIYTLKEVAEDINQSLKEAREEIKKLNHRMKVLEEDQRINNIYILALEEIVSQEEYEKCYKEALEEYELGKEDDE